MLKVSASLSFTPLLHPPLYYQKLLTLPQTFSTGAASQAPELPGLARAQARPLPAVKYLQTLPSKPPFHSSWSLCSAWSALRSLCCAHTTRAGSSAPSLLAPSAAGTWVTDPQVPSIPLLNRSCTWGNWKGFQHICSLGTSSVQSTWMRASV